MKQFTTAVQLSVKQAWNVLNKLYTIHYNCNGDPSSVDRERHRKTAMVLGDMMILPVGSVITMKDTYGSGKAIGYTTFTYDIPGTLDGIDSFVIYRDETSTAKDIAMIFVHARSFGHFKAELTKRMGYLWERTGGRPDIVEKNPATGQVKMYDLKTVSPLEKLVASHERNQKQMRELRDLHNKIMANHFEDYEDEIYNRL